MTPVAFLDHEPTVRSNKNGLDETVKSFVCISPT